MWLQKHQIWTTQGSRTVGFVFVLLWLHTLHTWLMVQCEFIENKLKINSEHKLKT